MNTILLKFKYIQAPHHSTPASHSNGMIQNLQRELALSPGGLPSPPQPPVHRPPPQSEIPHQPTHNQSPMYQPINVNPQTTQQQRHNDQMPEIRKYKKVIRKIHHLVSDLFFILLLDRN